MHSLRQLLEFDPNLPPAAHLFPTTLAQVVYDARPKARELLRDLLLDERRLLRLAVFDEVAKIWLQDQYQAISLDAAIAQGA